MKNLRRTTYKNPDSFETRVPGQHRHTYWGRGHETLEQYGHHQSWELQYEAVDAYTVPQSSFVL